MPTLKAPVCTYFPGYIINDHSNYLIKLKPTNLYFRSVSQIRHRTPSDRQTDWLRARIQWHALTADRSDTVDVREGCYAP